MYIDGLLSGKRILVTGGGTGLGRSMAEQFLTLGAEIYICGRRKSVCDATAAQLMAAHGGSVKTYGVDIRDAAAVDAMVEDIFAQGPLTGLVNNAAGNFISPTAALSPRGFDIIANIVMHGTFYVTHAVGRRWVQMAREGRWQAGDPYRSVMSIITTWSLERRAVRRTIGDEQECRSRDDHVAGHRMGTLWDQAECHWTGGDPHRGHEQALESRRRTGSAQRQGESDGTSRPHGRAAESRDISDERRLPLAQRPVHHDGRRRLPWNGRQFLRIAQLDRCAVAGGARTHRSPESKGSSATLGVVRLAPHLAYSFGTAKDFVPVKI